MKTAYLLALMVCLPAVAQENKKPTVDKFTISGVVRDAAGKPVANSVVIPLSEHGVPLNISDSQPATMQSIQAAEDKRMVIFTKTDDQGNFSLDLPAGAYRIVAQSWLDKPDATNLLDKNGSRLRVDGVVHVEFDSEMQASEKLEFKPIGTGEVTLSTQEKSDLLLVSVKPLACDPVLGFMALTGEFWSGLVAGTAMTKKSITISGLPAGELQFFSFVNDNNGGIGGAKTTLEEGQSSEVYLGVIAGWSNGHRTPPEELEELVQYVADHPQEMRKFNAYISAEQEKIKRLFEDAKNPNWIEMQIKFKQLLPKPWKFADGREATIADVWAALRYHDMKKKDRR